MSAKTLGICLFLLCVAVPTVLCISEEMMELARTLHNICVEKTGATEDQIEAARKGDFRDEQPLKCYMKCLMAEMAVIDDDGIIDAETLLALLPDEVKDQTVEDGIRKCGTKIGKDACDNAFLTHKCYYDTEPSKYFLI